ncbi:MAG TPA: Ig-like domain repeat protein [Jatrophihabitans sp.]|nr:Ig-like domain repeat protein [Jatrophihabitans sp.]
MPVRRLLTSVQCLTLTATFAVAVVALSPAISAVTPAPSGFPLGFGNDANGQVGAGTANDGTLNPMPSRLPDGVAAVQVAAGYSHTLALGTDGVVYAWGSNDHGELGNGGPAGSSVPTPVTMPVNTTVVSLAAGYLDSFAVTSTGAVYAWGYGGQGELGTGNSDDATTPTLLSLPSGVEVSSVSAGYAHTLALTSTGAIYAWGANSAGQLGDGTLNPAQSPVKVQVPSGTTMTMVSAGWGHSVALSSTGHVYTWGANNRGQLGLPARQFSVLPVPVDLGTAKATSVAAGYEHTVATLSDGSALAWGDNAYGQLGAGKSATTLPSTVSPVAVQLGSVHVTSVAAGFAHTLLLGDSGAALATGDNNYGELGTGDRGAGSTSPVPVALPAGSSAFVVATSSFSLTSFVLVAPVPTTTTVTTTSPSVTRGQPVTFTATVAPNSGAGTVTLTSRDTGTPLAGCANLPLHAAAGGGYRATCSTAALPAGTTAIGASYSGGAQYTASAGTLAGGQQVTTTSGVATAWGANGSGQLGDGSKTTRTEPVAVAFPPGTQVEQVAAGSNHALAILSDGSVYAWGDNTYGELGDGSNTNSKSPVRVTLPPDVVPVRVVAGALTSALLASDGTLYTWGFNSVGQLGNGGTTDASQPTPVALPPGTIVTAVALGGAHLLALTSTGAVYAAGGNTAGQLGTNSVAPAPTPVLVHLPAGVSVADVAAGRAHSLAVTSDGAVLAWGDDSHGQLGTGTNNPAVVPVPTALPPGVTVTSVSAGANHSLALTTDATVLAWGANDAGQLGIGTDQDGTSPAPVTLPSGTQVTAIGAGSSTSYALVADGSMLAWGDNASGAVGDGSTAPRLSPVAVHRPPGGTATALASGDASGAGYALVPRINDQVAVTSSANPSMIGSVVTFTATVSPGDGGGTVAFTDGGSTMGGCDAVPLSGTGPYTATCSTNALSAGSHAIAATYTGDPLYLASGGALDGGQTVNRHATATKVTASVAKVAYGKSVTFTATVTGSDGGGSVAFAYDGTTIPGCAAKTLASSFVGYQAKCLTTALPPGHHVITAAYSGDARYGPSTATLTGGELVTAATKLVASPVKITSTTGVPTYRAVLTVQADGTPLVGMTVKFTLNSLYGASSCSAVTNDSGVASCQGARPRRSGGQYTAKFAGTDVYLSSSGSAIVSF